jgi:flavodoxin
MSKTLVAYFSASGITEKMARNLASAVDGDLHEIKPEKPYTSADLDWTNKKSRSSVEMNDKAFRPAVSNKVENIEQYDVIYVGFPIWWYVAPTIINTFLEQYSMEGKTVIPFATSGMSGMGKTNAELRNSCKGAVLREGKRFEANASVAELKKWSDSIVL